MSKHICTFCGVPTFSHIMDVASNTFCSLTHLDQYNKSKPELTLGPFLTNTPPVAQRFNEGKVDLTFNPTKGLIAQARVWMYGAKKYARDNWKKLWGEDTVNVALASAYRHMEAMKSGEMVDPESGCLHAGHVMCNMAMIVEHLDKEGVFKVE
jgi:hypothetical protein